MRHKSQVMKAPTWLTALSLTACVVALPLCPEPYIAYYFVAAVLLTSLSVLFFMGTYSYWALKDPDRLGWSVELLSPPDMEST